MGVLKWHDGWELCGEWLADKLSGNGEFVHSALSICYRGQIKSGTWHGYGVCSDGEGVYQGEWVNFKRHGLGRFIKPDGRVVDSLWHDGNQTHVLRDATDAATLALQGYDRGIYFLLLLLILLCTTTAAQEGERVAASVRVLAAGISGKLNQAPPSGTYLLSYFTHYLPTTSLVYLLTHHRHHLLSFIISKKFVFMINMLVCKLLGINTFLHTVMFTQNTLGTYIP